MVKTEEKEIDGIRFIVTGFPAIPALHMKARLGLVIVPAFTQLLSGSGAEIFKKGTKALDTKMEDVLPLIGPAIETLLTKITPDEFTSICVALMKGTIVVLPERDGAKAKKVELSRGDAAFNEVFSGDLATLYKAIWFVLQVNDFFGLGGIGKLAGIFERAKALLNPGSNLPPEN